MPTVTETHVFTVGGFGDVHCLDRKTHEAVWHFNLGKRYTAGKLNWGYAQSPLVYKDTVILTPTHEETPVLIAVKATTGEKVWESPAPDKGGEFSADYYNSPVIRTVLGVQGVMLLSNNQVSFVNPDDGQLIWKYNGYGVKFSIPSPTVLPDGERIFITGGYGCGSVMIRVKKSGEAYAFDEIFRLPKDGSQLHPALAYGDHLYVNINENDKIKTKATRKDGGLACMDPTNGNILWRTGRDENQPFFDRGHVLRVGDKLLILEGQLGSLHLAQAVPTGYQELARAQVFHPEKPRDNNIWAPMAWVDGLLVLRDQHEIKCLDLRPAGQ